MRLSLFAPRRLATFAWLSLLLLLACLGSPVAAQPPQAPTPEPPPATLFVDVNIVPMDGETVLRGRSVLVIDGRIAAIGERIEAPPGAQVIGGRGAWLLPGLADMHVHVRDREALAMLLASGITTALDMGEAPNAMVGRTREAVARGDLPGPRLFAALAVDGSPRYGHLVLPSPEAARWAVRLARANGYDFIKAYNGLSPEVFAALAQEGRAAGLPIVGHSVETLGLERQVAGGQAMIAHLEEFLYAFFRIPEGGEDPLAVPQESEIARAVDFVKRSGVAVTADLVTFQAIAAQWGRPEQVREYLRRPETRYLSPGDRIAWRRSGYQRRTGSLEPRAAFLGRFVKALADAEALLVAGTDAPTIAGLAVGDALHRNLAALEAAGLSPYQALATATRGPGEFARRALPGRDRFGIVAEGARADLLLVAGNPLDDLATLREPIGVMAGGRWHDSAALAALRDGVAALYSAEE